MTIRMSDRATSPSPFVIPSLERKREREMLFTGKKGGGQKISLLCAGD